MITSKGANMQPGDRIKIPGQPDQVVVLAGAYTMQTRDLTWRERLWDLVRWTVRFLSGSDMRCARCGGEGHEAHSCPRWRVGSRQDRETACK